MLCSKSSTDVARLAFRHFQTLVSRQQLCITTKDFEYVLSMSFGLRYAQSRPRCSDHRDEIWTTSQQRHGEFKNACLETHFKRFHTQINVKPSLIRQKSLGSGPGTRLRNFHCGGNSKCLVTRDVKFEPTDPALGPKSVPTGLLRGMNVMLPGSCRVQNEQPNTKRIYRRV